MLIASLLFAAAASTASADELLGLWKAKRRFGPDARGALVIQRTGSAYVAEIVGRAVPVRVEGGELRFALPNGEGSFRGRFRDGVIAGHWLQPQGRGQNAGGVFASPVRLRPDGAGRWTGRVAPFDDDFTLYLLLRKRADGSVGAVLRNPERDYGGQLGVDALVRDGSDVKLTTRRGDVRGTYDAERGVITLAFPERGGSYDFAREGDESDFYPRGKHPAGDHYRPPPARDDGWPTGTLAEAKIDPRTIEAMVQAIAETPQESLDSPEIHGILVARHGKLVLEEYFHGHHRDKLHELRSAAKSITATVAGAAMQAGLPVSLSTPVYRTMGAGAPELDPRKRAMTLENLLTMASGYFCDDTNPQAPGNEEVMNEQEKEPDYYRYTLAVPMLYEPGEKSVYCSANPHLALGVVGRAAGEDPLELFDRLLAVPMKIDRYAWPLDPAGHPYGGGGVQLLPRDFLKFGQLMLNGGIWQGRRLLGRDFVARASARLYHLRGIHYGYLWWGMDFPYRGGTVQAYFASGAGGQMVTVVPALDLVIGTIGGNFTSRTAIHMSQEVIPPWILAAVDAAARAEPPQWKTPYAPSPDGSRVK